MLCFLRGDEDPLEFTLRRPSGMRGFYVIWIGQMISGIASNITFFALPIWILNMTETSGGALGLWEAFYFGSYLAVVLIAGVFIDRYSRKRMMLIYDLLSLVSTAILLVLQAADQLQVWHLYVAAVTQGVGYAFHSPSYSAVITTLIPKRQYVQANGLMSLLYDTPDIFGPVLAGVLYLSVGLGGILALNLLAFAISIGALLFVEIPPTPQSSDEDPRDRSFWADAFYGIKYIVQRPSLLGVQLIFFFGNFFTGIALSVTALFTMILLRTGGDASAAGTIQSIGALAAVVAGVYLSLIGGIKRPVRAILIGWVVSTLFGLTLLGVSRVILLWAIAMIINTIFEPVVNVAIDTFMQTKVPPDVQGRVFAASDFLAQAMIPITPLLAGFFGETIFEPAMEPGGPLANIFGGLVGVGPGAGFGLMIFLCGIGGALVGLSGFLIPEIRNVNQWLPDYKPAIASGLMFRIRPRTERRKAKQIGTKRVQKKNLNPWVKNLDVDDPTLDTDNETGQDI